MQVSTKIIHVVFEKKIQVAHGMFTFHFLFPNDFHYLAGQYIQMTLPHDDSDERGSSRFFTISSSPTEKDFLFITTRKGKSSFKKALFDLAPGTQVQFFGPIGTFILMQN